jgi:hypothetical protein
MSNAPGLTDADWWSPDDVPRTPVESFKTLYEHARALELARRDFLLKPCDATRLRLEVAAREMAECVGDNTEAKKGRRPKRRLPSAGPE